MQIAKMVAWKEAFIHSPTIFKLLGSFPDFSWFGDACIGFYVHMLSMLGHSSPADVGQAPQVDGPCYNAQEQVRVGECHQT